MNTTTDCSRLDSDLSEGLGPLPAPVEVARRRALSGLVITHAYTTAQMEAERQRCYALGVAAERERCAKLCDDISDEYQRTEGRRYPELKSDAQEGASACADAIRA